MPKPCNAGSLAGENGYDCDVALVQYDEDAEHKVAAGLLYQFSGMPYGQVLTRVEQMSEGDLAGLFDACMDGMGDHDAPPRAFEMADYTFEFTLDYGAYREFKRHRMQSYIPQPLNLEEGYLTPELVVDAGLEGEYTGGYGPGQGCLHQDQGAPAGSSPVPGHPCSSSPGAGQDEP